MALALSSSLIASLLLLMLCRHDAGQELPYPIEEGAATRCERGEASSNPTARLRQSLRASCASAAEGAAHGLFCDPRHLVNEHPPSAAPSLAATARGLLRPSLRRAAVASCPALRSSKRAQRIVSASAAPHGYAPAVAPRGQFAGRGSAARPDILPVFMLWQARPCSVCPAPCLAVCSRRVLRPAVCSHQTGARRQPPAHTTAARLGPAACSASSVCCWLLR